MLVQAVLAKYIYWTFLFPTWALAACAVCSQVPNGANTDLGNMKVCRSKGVNQVPSAWFYAVGYNAASGTRIINTDIKK